MYRVRLWTVAALFLLPLVGIAARLVSLQVVQADDLSERARLSMQRLRFHSASRGRILAADGTVLAEDAPAFDLSYRLGEADPTIEAAGFISWLLRMEKGSVRNLLLAERPVPLLLPEDEQLATRARLARYVRALDFDGESAGLPPGQGRQLERSVAALAELLPVDAATLREEIERRLAEVWERPRVLDRRAGLVSSFPLARNIGAEEAWTIAERGAELPGFDVEVRLERRFPQGNLAPHVIGFLGQLSPEDVQRLRGEDRRRGAILEDRRGMAGLDEFLDMRNEAHFMSDRIGKTGIERQFESRLRGEPGAELVLVAHGERVQSVAGEVRPEAGQDVPLTLLPAAQRAAESLLVEVVGSLLKGRKEERVPRGGAAVLLDVRTGEVLVMASAPTFDLETRRSLDPLEPLLGPRGVYVNRAISGVYPTGSVFKVFSGYLGLAHGRLGHGERVVCNNRLFPGVNAWACNNHARGMALEIREALARSCNVYFFHLGEHKLLEDELTEGARQFGFGQRTGIDLPAEAEGLVPDSQWKRRRYDEAQTAFHRAQASWEAAQAAAATSPNDAEASGALVAAEGRLEQARRHKAWWDEKTSVLKVGERRNLAIGQGDLMATPLQVAVATAALANGGTVWKPRVARLEGPVAARRLLLDPAARASVVAGMRDVVTMGTARAYHLNRLPFSVCAKTGTAQDSGPGDHAWLAGFAPMDNPRYAFAVVVENVPEGLHGGEICSPIAAAMLREAMAAESGR